VFYTYVLQCEQDPTRHYTGSTDDLKRRLAEHNAGKCPHTAKYRPWKLKSYFAFDRADIAHRSEAYLKTGSGREFARRHFEPVP
jgi:predicted GIY-YIG superfamily endonuclease